MEKGNGKAKGKRNGEGKFKQVAGGSGFSQNR